MADLPKHHELGMYSTIYRDYCATLKIKASTATEHEAIDPKKSVYHAEFDFWHASRGEYAGAKYNAHGFTGVFMQLPKFLPGIIAVLARDRHEIENTIAQACIDRCVEDLQKQTRHLDGVTEQPPTPMCR